MEKIKINDIQKKPAKGGSLMILKLNGDREATIAPFEKQEQWFLEEEVGIGGSFSGEIVVDGAYTNIKNIDMTSGVKGEPTQDNQENPEVQGKPTNDRECSIVAQVLVKSAVRMYCSESAINCSQGEYLSDAVRELAGVYKLALSELN